MYEAIKTTVESQIKENGNNEITGDLLQSVLIAIINTLGGGASIIGTATPATVPTPNDWNVVYFAYEVGNYPGFGITINREGVYLFKKSGSSWISEMILPGNINTNNLFGVGEIIDDVLINTEGAKVSVNRWQMIKMPVVPGKQYTVGRLFLDIGYNLAFYSSADNYISGSVSVVTTGQTVTVTAPNNSAWMYVNIKRPNDNESVYQDAGIYEGSVLWNNNVIASIIGSNNFTADPVDPENAVNKRYLLSTSVLISDLTAGKPNLFIDALIIEGQLIATSGAKQSVSGWKMARIEVDPDKTYSIANLFIANSYNAAFYNASDSYIAGSISTGLTGESISAVSPPNAKYLYVNLKRPTDTDVVFENTIIYEGENQITEIKGIPIKAGDGEQYDQSLNTFDNVEFANVKVNGMELDLPTGATEPVGLEIGDAWVDTANGNVIKVKLS